MELKHKATLYALYAAANEKGAVCAQEGPTWDQGPESVQAEMCQRCPVKKECKAYADTDPENTWGVWGGMKYPRTKRGKIANINTEG